MTIDEKLQEVCKLFRINDTYLGHEVIQVGNVNKTYRVRFLRADGSEKSYLVQNVNTYVFKNPVKVMENIDKVTEHIRAKRPGQTALHFHHTDERKTYVMERDNFWRMTNYIPSKTYGATGDLDIVRNAGNAFGEFQMQLSDFEISDLHETIPNFHNTRARYESLDASVAADPKGYVSQVREELDYLFSVRDQACALTDMAQRGELPLRVTHNDTKINNVLFHPENGRALVVIDLDTVMPGLVGHDFGDAIRFAANMVEEDSSDYDKARVDLDVFRAFCLGFLEKTANILTQKEIEILSLSCFALTVELAVRFLDDYIQGSPYFKINYPEHNLVRARCQIALAKDMAKNLEKMNTCIQDCIAQLK